MQFVPAHLDLPLFWKSHCATCSPVYVILYHVTGSCKGPIKVVICYPNGDVSVKSKFDRESQNIIRNISLGKWKSVANASFRHERLAPELRETFSQEIARECKNYSKADSCLQYNSPVQLAVFSNKIALQRSRITLSTFVCSVM